MYSKEVESLASLVQQLSSYPAHEKSDVRALLDIFDLLSEPFPRLTARGFGFAVTQALAACDAKVARIKELKQGFTTEKRLIRDKAVRAQYEAVRALLK